MPAIDGGAPEEITAARLDRELNELLQELRVEQNGILLLIGFLLVIPFSTRFNHVSKFERDVYYLTLLTAGLAALVIIAPVAHHRLVFRKHEKEALVRRGHQLASAGLVLLSMTLLGVLVLVTNFLFRHRADDWYERGLSAGRGYAVARAPAANTAASPAAAEVKRRIAAEPDPGGPEMTRGAA